MEDKRIKNQQITALNWLYQSGQSNRDYSPRFARLNNKREGGGGWCSEPIELYQGAYIEIDLLKNTRLTAIASQGREIGGEYIDEYGVTYKRDNDKSYREYKERGRWHIFKANNGSKTIVRNSLKHPIIARKIRIVPQGDSFATYCGRFELYGCKWKKSKDGLVSYLLPLANKFNNLQTLDNTYDGSADKQLSYKAGGLGKLADDTYGATRIGSTTSSKWIAYKKRSKFKPFFQFEFAAQRRFSAIKFHTINKGSDIKVFTQVKVLFSNDGRKFGQEKLYSTSAAERLSSSAFIITIPVSDVVAKFIKCVFSQPGEWMLFSEVDFTSVPPNAPKPTRPPLITKEPTVVAKTDKVKEVAEVVTKADIKTTAAATKRPTPRLLFSLPSEITAIEITKYLLPATKRTKDEDKNSENDVAGKDNQNTSPTLESKPAKGSLSFPIIIAIVLGAIVISAISAVLIVRHIRRMGKEKKRPPATNGQAQRPQKALSQSPEFHELLLYEKQVPSPIVVTAVLPKNEQSTKLIMDSGYTSHGSAGGSVKEVVVRQNTNGNIV
eukprot:Seg140.2 transcript_id=Seg140.2/GoldUCD/mRNA.D3Y31 product="Discoidin domain-containing receptor 2" protein_id=Seg140.2/GoldUCD/D3Y31